MPMPNKNLKLEPECWVGEVDSTWVQLPEDGESRKESIFGQFASVRYFPNLGWLGRTLGFRQDAIFGFGVWALLLGGFACASERCNCPQLESWGRSLGAENWACQSWWLGGASQGGAGWWPLEF